MDLIREFSEGREPGYSSAESKGTSTGRSKLTERDAFTNNIVGFPCPVRYAFCTHRLPFF
jgi:hypothetical protein